MQADATIPSTHVPEAGPRGAREVKLSDYVQVGVALASYGALLVFVTQTSTGPQRPETLWPPMFFSLLLTAAVWAIMVVVRNYSILRGIASSSYYVDYARQQPPEWVERPARAFNNLLQVPVLFYVLVLSVQVSGHMDSAQLALAWIYVATRALHVTIYIGWNYVPYRFAAWLASCITLIVLWSRFALHS